MQKKRYYQDEAINWVEIHLYSQMKGRICMLHNNLSIYDASIGCSSLMTPAGGSSGNLVSDILSALPSCIAKPFLDYQRTKSQKELLEFAIQAKRMEKEKILETMQVLAKYDQLTPELSDWLMQAYMQPIY